MPAGQPFTALCQQLAHGPRFGRADLHLHTTCSDGSYCPAEVVDLARRSGLLALAVTDHDTLGGIAPARAAALGTGLEVIPGVEITSEFRGHEMHLLAYFIDPDDAALNAALAGARRDREVRYAEMIDRLRGCGIALTPADLKGKVLPEALGRRHLAEALVKAGRVPTVREAFRQYLGDGARAAVPKRRPPVAEVLTLVHGAGGVGSWAHPPDSCDLDALTELRSLGLDAVEVEYPDIRGSRNRALRAWAKQLGLEVTGGSDCHGPGPRAIGCRSVTAAELEQLRARAARG
jgi:predicted metal-dependent phosphoesterase TrpH